MSKKKPHHHGNLREALIHAGIEILDEEGMAGLSLRRVAKRAGVSHAAPAHHFTGKDGLLAAIAARGYSVFSRIMTEDRAAAAPDAWSQLQGLCDGYLRFAQEHEALFQLIFATEFDGPRTPELEAASEEAFGLLVETCAAFQPSERGALVNEITVWSLVHGYATLKRFGRLKRTAQPEILHFGAVLAGLRLRT